MTNSRGMILAALRGEVLPECVPTDGPLILRDGTPKMTLPPLKSTHRVAFSASGKSAPNL